MQIYWNHPTACPGRIKILSPDINGYSILESIRASNPWKASLLWVFIFMKNVHLTWKSEETDDDVTWSVCASSTKSRPLGLPDSGVGSNLSCPNIVDIFFYKLNNTDQISSPFWQPWTSHCLHCILFRHFDNMLLVSILYIHLLSFLFVERTTHPFISGLHFKYWCTT